MAEVKKYLLLPSICLGLLWPKLNFRTFTINTAISREDVYYANSASACMSHTILEAISHDYRGSQSTPKVLNIWFKFTHPGGLTASFLMKCRRVNHWPVRTGWSSPKTCKLSLYIEVSTRASYFPIYFLTKSPSSYTQ